MHIFTAKGSCGNVVDEAICAWLTVSGGAPLSLDMWLVHGVEKVPHSLHLQ